MNSVQVSLRQYVDIHVEMSNSLHPAFHNNDMYSRLKSEGKFFGVLPHRPSEYPLQKIQMCFQNSYRMLAHPELEYVEGVAYSGLIPVHHSWNLDLNGNVIDTTWRTRGKYARHSEGREYFGIHIPRKELEEVIFETGTYGFWKY